MESFKSLIQLIEESFPMKRAMLHTNIHSCTVQAYKTYIQKYKRETVKFANSTTWERPAQLRTRNYPNPIHGTSSAITIEWVKTYCYALGLSSSTKSLSKVILSWKEPLKERFPWFIQHFSWAKENTICILLNETWNIREIAYPKHT